MEAIKKFTAEQIAELLGGELVGASQTMVTGASGVETAANGDITFAETDRIFERAIASEAAVVLCSAERRAESKTLIHVPNPRLAFANILAHFAHALNIAQGVHPKVSLGDNLFLGEEIAIGPFVSIGKNVKLGNRVTVHPFCFIGDDVEVGDDTVLFPNVSIMSRVKIGARCRFHPGAVIGADGFGYVFDQGKHVKMPEIGAIEIGDDVEVGANTCIDRATTGVTRIGSGVKMDNLVQVGHNVQMGQGCILVSGVGIGGSSVLGNYVILAGQVGVIEHRHVGDGVQVGAQSGVLNDLPAGAGYWGTPAVRKREEFEAQVYKKRLPELFKQVRALEKELAAMKARLGEESEE